MLCVQYQSHQHAKAVGTSSTTKLRQGWLHLLQLTISIESTALMTRMVTNAMRESHACAYLVGGFGRRNNFTTFARHFRRSRHRTMPRRRASSTPVHHASLVVPSELKPTSPVQTNSCIRMASSRTRSASAHLMYCPTPAPASRRGSTISRHRFPYYSSGLYESVASALAMPHDARHPRRRPSSAALLNDRSKFLGIRATSRAGEPSLRPLHARLTATPGRQLRVTLV